MWDHLVYIGAETTEPAPTLAGVEAETPATATPASIEPADDDSFVEVEGNKDDKMRRIAKTLQAGDVVEQAHVSFPLATMVLPLIHLEHSPHRRG